jgi:hypothetical protein
MCEQAVVCHGLVGLRLRTRVVGEGLAEKRHVPVVRQEHGQRQDAGERARVESQASGTTRGTNEGGDYFLSSTSLRPSIRFVTAIGPAA